jgi:hypothetical protein
MVKKKTESKQQLCQVPAGSKHKAAALETINSEQE